MKCTFRSLFSLTLSYPARIRTLTNSTKNCCATVTLPGTDTRTIPGFLDFARHFVGGRNRSTIIKVLPQNFPVEMKFFTCVFCGCPVVFWGVSLFISPSLIPARVPGEFSWSMSNGLDSKKGMCRECIFWGDFAGSFRILNH